MFFFLDRPAFYAIVMRKGTTVCHTYWGQSVFEITFQFSQVPFAILNEIP